VFWAGDVVGHFECAQTGKGCGTPSIGFGDLGVALSTGNTVEEMFRPQQVTAVFSQVQGRRDHQATKERSGGKGGY